MHQPEPRQLGDYRRQVEHQMREQEQIARADRQFAGLEPTPGRDLPEHCYQARRMREAGIRVEEIARHFGKDRTTIWRWLQAVDKQNSDRLRGRDPFELTMQLLEDCEHLEADARMAMTRAQLPDDRAKHRGEARRLLKQRMDLLRYLGLLQVARDQGQGAGTLVEDLKKFMVELREELL